MRASSLRRSTCVTTSAIRSALAAGSLNNSVNTARTCGTVTAGVFPPQPQPLHLQEPQRQQRQRHVVVPAHPAAHLVMPQPHLALALLQQLLHAVPPAVRPRQLPALRLAGVAQRVPRPWLLLAAAQHHQALARSSSSRPSCHFSKKTTSVGT